MFHWDQSRHIWFDEFLNSGQQCKIDLAYKLYLPLIHVLCMQNKQNLTRSILCLEPLPQPLSLFCLYLLSILTFSSLSIDLLLASITTMQLEANWEPYTLHLPSCKRNLNHTHNQSLVTDSLIVKVSQGEFRCGETTLLYSKCRFAFQYVWSDILILNITVHKGARIVMINYK